VSDPSIAAIIGTDTSSGTMAMARWPRGPHRHRLADGQRAGGDTRTPLRLPRLRDRRLEALAVAQLARERLHAKRAVILRDTRNDYSVGIAETFTKAFTAAGGTAGGGIVAGTFDYAAGDSDFRAQLTSAKALAPDVLVVPGYYGDVAQIVSQARDLGMTVPLLAAAAGTRRSCPRSAGKSIEGNWFVSWLRSPSAKFVADFHKRYGFDPDGANAQAYDAWPSSPPPSPAAAPTAPRSATPSPAPATSTASPAASPSAPTATRRKRSASSTSRTAASCRWGRLRTADRGFAVRCSLLAARWQQRWATQQPRNAATSQPRNPKNIHSHARPVAECVANIFITRRDRLHRQPAHSELLARGHVVRALVRNGSVRKLPPA